MQNSTEQWCDVAGYNGRYRVSDHGGVWSATNYKASPEGGPLALCAGPNGYVTVVLYDGTGGKRTRYVHHLVLEAFVGERGDDQETRHLNANRTDNRLDNLAWGTSSENNRDIVELGRHPESNKTHCVNGHPFSGDNLYFVPNRPKVRLCRQCKADYQAKVKARRAAGIAPGPVGRPKKNAA